MNIIRKNIISTILIFWSIFNFLMFSSVYITWGLIPDFNNGINGYELMFTFNKESFITILAVIQIFFTLITLSMLVLGILMVIYIKNFKKNSSMMYCLNLVRLLPFLVISLNIILIATIVVGIKPSSGTYLYSWYISPRVYFQFYINIIIAIIVLTFSKTLIRLKLLFVSSIVFYVSIIFLMQ